MIHIIPADNQGNKLILKDYRRQKDGRMFLKYRSTWNDIPFRETEVFLVDSGKNLAILGGDGTVL